jgi:Asp-tRNA(Asn)/Glu-tRNA(Gln) amidotransferase A subunit family amidase
VDAAARAGRAGPLAGLALGVKDVLDTADQPSQYGSPIWAGHRPRGDAACVALARRAGAVVAGKTVTTEFATRFPGPTTNPRDARRTPGGSSSGSAAGVAAGLLHLAFGTQTAGSVIRPAAYCGAVGYKPAHGALHRAGMKVMSESLDTIGLLARDVAAVALAMSALPGLDHGEPGRAEVVAPRLALVLGPGEAALEPCTLALFERAERALAAKGTAVERRALPEALLRANAAHARVMNMESAEALAWEMDHARALLSPVLRERMEWGAAEPREKLAEGRALFAAAREAFAGWSAGADAILTPAAPGEAPEGLGWTGDPACNSLWTLLHAPCVTVPAGDGPNGMPLGVQLVGRAGEEARLLALAEWVRRALAS